MNRFQMLEKLAARWPTNRWVRWAIDLTFYAVTVGGSLYWIWRGVA